MRFLLEHEVAERDRLSKSTRRRLILQGRYPAPLKLSDGRRAWREDEHEAWMAGLPRCEWAVAASLKQQDTEDEQPQGPRGLGLGLET